MSDKDKILKFSIQQSNLDKNIKSLIDLGIHNSPNVIEKTLDEYENALKPIQTYMHMLIDHMRVKLITKIMSEIGTDVNYLKNLETRNKEKFATEEKKFNEALASTHNVKKSMFGSLPKKNESLGNVVFETMTHNNKTPIFYFSEIINLVERDNAISIAHTAIKEIELKYYINDNKPQMTTAKQIFSKLPSLLNIATQIQTQSSGNETYKADIDAIVKNLTDYQARLNTLNSIFKQKYAEYNKAHGELSNNQTIKTAIINYNKLVDDLNASVETMEETVRKNTRTYKDAYIECCVKTKTGGKPKTSRKYRRKRTIRRRKSNRK